MKSVFDLIPPKIIVNDNKYFHPVHKYLYCDDNGFLHSADKDIYLYMALTRGKILSSYSVKSFSKTSAAKNYLGGKNKVVYECFHGKIIDKTIYLRDENFYNTRLKNLTTNRIEANHKNGYRKIYLKENINEGIRRAMLQLPHLFKAKDIDGIDYYIDLLRYPKMISDGIKKRAREIIGK